VAVYVATDHKITVNGTALSNVLQSVSLDLSSDEIETTAFGGGWRTRIAGLKSGSVTLNFYQDFAASSVDAILAPLFTNGSYGTVVVTPTSSATSATNPAWTAVCLVSQYNPFSASVGDIATLSVTWPTSGTVSRATA
jgi:predicted secreted protein